MPPLRVTCWLVVACGVLGSAQSAPIPRSTDVAFEVVSVKPNKSGDRNSSTGGRAGGFAATNVTAQRLIFAALQEQLGLRLDSQRGPVEFLYVDKIERPTPD